MGGNKWIELPHHVGGGCGMWVSDYSCTLLSSRDADTCRAQVFLGGSGSVTIPRICGSDSSGRRHSVSLTFKFDEPQTLQQVVKRHIIGNSDGLETAGFSLVLLRDASLQMRLRTDDAVVTWKTLVDHVRYGLWYSFQLTCSKRGKPSVAVTCTDHQQAVCTLKRVGVPRFDRPLFSIRELLRPESHRALPRSRTRRANRAVSPVAQLLVCHDFKGGYKDDGYTFYHWDITDIFVYFSHHRVTVPPVHFIDAGHLAGTYVLGCLLTEWTDGLKDTILLLKHRRAVVDRLVHIANHVGFDGYLLNFESQVPPHLIGDLLQFVADLSSRLSKVIWYDSVSALTGFVHYQNDLNAHNQPFCDACDGIFLNYWWDPDKLTHLPTGSFNVYAGVDVWGRGTYGGGGFNTAKALYSEKHSYALFAPGWSYEKDPPNFALRDERLWQGIPWGPLDSTEYQVLLIEARGEDDLCLKVAGKEYHGSSLSLVTFDTEVKEISYTGVQPKIHTLKLPLKNSPQSIRGFFGASTVWGSGMWVQRLEDHKVRVICTERNGERLLLRRIRTPATVHVIADPVVMIVCARGNHKLIGSGSIQFGSAGEEMLYVELTKDHCYGTVELSVEHTVKVT